MPVELELLTPDALPAFRDLLGSASFGGCFCAVWTSHDAATWAERCADPARPNLAITERDLRAGRHVGFLVREDGRVVGWTGSGPKRAFPLLGTKLGSRLSPAEGAWSIGCLALPAAERGRGLADRIVAAVIEAARRAGAERVEAYPVRPFHEPRAYRGTVELYARAGFVEVGAELDGEHAIALVARAVGVNGEGGAR